MLVAMTAVLLLLMPWSECSLTFDNFLLSGQDLEFGLLAVAIILCLVLVLSQHRRRGIDFLLGLCELLATVCRSSRGMMRPGFSGYTMTPPGSARSSPPTAAYSLPLQI